MFTATDWIRDKNGLMVLTPFPIKWAGKAANQVYHKLRQKDTGNDAASRTFLQRKGSIFVQPLSLASLDSSPSRGASGETVHFAGTAKASPFGRGVTEGDGEGKPGTKEHLHSDKHWLLIESSYRCVFVLSQRPCPLRRSAPAPPKGEPLACRSGFHWTSKARCLGNGSAPLSRPAAA